MTSRPARLGDFLSAAHDQLSAAAFQASAVAPGRDLHECRHGLHRVIMALSMYTGDLTRVLRQLPAGRMAENGSWNRAALRAHGALASAASILAVGPGDGMDADSMNSQAGQRLCAAARLLVAGRDLLQGHFRISPSGARLHRSSWAVAASSPEVSRALLAQIGTFAREAAGVGAAAAAPVTGRRWPTGVQSRITSACRSLQLAEENIRAADQRQRVSGAGHEVLTAIPAAIMPSRAVAAEAGSVASICEAVTTTAQRARHAAWAATDVAPNSPAISVTSWQEIAAACTVTSHHCSVLYQTLAERVGVMGPDADLIPALQRAAEHASLAREEWLDGVREFRGITTDVLEHRSPAAIEATDLALWTGRLAYADPGWKLPDGPSAPARPARALAPRLSDVPEVVSAVHHAADACSRLAVANLEQVHKAALSRRVFIATKSMTDSPRVAGLHIALRVVPAPSPYVASLTACCQDTAHAAARTAESAAEIAIRTGAPSRILAAEREVVRRSLEHPAVTAEIAGGVAASAEAQRPQAEPPRPEAGHVGARDARLEQRASLADAAGRRVTADAADVVSPVLSAHADLSVPSLRPRQIDASGARRMCPAEGQELEAEA